MQTPQPQWSPATPTPAWSPSPGPRRERGPLLSFFVGVRFFSASVGLVIFTFLAKKTTGQDAWVVLRSGRQVSAANFSLFFAALCVVILVCLSGVWTWKKWGVYGYAILQLVTLWLVVNVSRASLVMSLAWDFVVLLILTTKWRHFE
jgi:hypothetical protein